LDQGGLGAEDFAEEASFGMRFEVKRLDETGGTVVHVGSSYRRRVYQARNVD